MAASSNRQILFMGDTSLQTAASYLAGCLAKAGYTFDYLASDQPIKPTQLESPYQLYILSDYPAEQFAPEHQERLLGHLESGSNLLMIGGWESFQGLAGGWQGTLIGEQLPVLISEADDRQNCDCPVFLQSQCEHPITAGFPWEQRPPLIGGYNSVIAKPEGKTLLTAERYRATLSVDGCQLTHLSSDPLLVIKEIDGSRVSALMTDLAPHWVGPLVDWGDERVAAQAEGAEEVEVGQLYYQFVTQLLSWAGNF